MTDRNALIAQFLDRAGWGQAHRGVLAGDASFRRYDRLTTPAGSAVLMDAPPPQEDVRPFIRIARHLERMGFSAPRILAQDVETGLLLLEDLGDATYTRLLAQGHDERALYMLALDTLAHLHGRDDAIPDGVPPYDDQKLLDEACLLTDWYMPAVLDRPTSDDLRQEYRALWGAVLSLCRTRPATLVLRDFHVDNLLLLDRPGLQACGLLDFQDAVSGSPVYDVMSLLEDARRDIDAGLIADGKARYLAHFPQWDRADFDTAWAVMAAQRHAKVIGIFTRLCRRDGKPLYLGHIPRVWRLLNTALAHPALIHIKSWTDRHIPPDSRIIPTP